ncbi:MAG: heterodisulfide reductase-related iron-sulfur binding cluster, partial [bacterium]
MRNALFLGCTTPSKGRAYEISARNVLKALGVEYEDVLDFACCGFPIKPASFDASMISALRNIAIS